MKTATGKTRNMKGAHDARVWMLQHLDAPSVEGLKDYLISDQELAQKFNIPVVTIAGIRKNFGIPKAFVRTQIANNFLRLNRAPTPTPDTTVDRKGGEDINVPTNVPTKLPAWCKEGQWVFYDGNLLARIECFEKVSEDGSTSPTTYVVLKSYDPHDNLSFTRLPKQIKPVRFRPYSFDEARVLLGKEMEYFSLNGKYKHFKIIIDVGESEDGCHVNWYSHTYWRNRNGTIDGIPFGIPEVDEDSLKGGAE